MTHLADDDLRGQDRPQHVATCAECRLRWESWQRLTAATRLAADALAPPLAPPPFDSLLLPAIAAPAPRATEARPAETPRRVRAWRTGALLVRWQARLMPRLLLPASVLGLAAATAIALLTPDPRMATHGFAAVVVLTVLLGSLATCTRRADPRTDLLHALPISPVTVFAARLVLVLAVDVLLALGCSVAVHAAGVGTGVPDLVAGWLGQSLLASATAVVCAVRYSPGVGAAAAVALWCLGSVTSLSRGGIAERLGRVFAHVWGTTPWTVVVALALFALATHQVRQLPARRWEPA
ncbi:hypothetical protein [Actinokineospora diospyrosa]|uniref:Integral membrane protein n=1 Tax=Actinokineospora diospyrosa TaxID=103728 RepID=A0ABT1IH15_9PSEU|nr:hypothetical protein [Actinokineospora diospyrosa]MCP2271561.1 hypothetical protein [Actinokineospora diospyrosa]